MCIPRAVTMLRKMYGVGNINASRTLAIGDTKNISRYEPRFKDRNDLRHSPNVGNRQLGNRKAHEACYVVECYWV